MKPANYPCQPAHLWDVFFQFTQTPRPSKHEQKIKDYLLELAKKYSCHSQIDQAGNVIIFVPGKNGRENDAPILIQNHLDMVTDALPDRQINFTTDPIQTYVEGEWLKAKGTTLGADNGIGCAAALATLMDKSLIHPPLELLFTVDEETGLHGALGLEHQDITAKRMLNLDTEEWGSLYIGCAGGIDYEFNHELKLQSASASQGYKIQIEGFLGGHSGVDIHEQRGNAIKFLAEFLQQLQTACPFELAEIRAGKAHNIIPRDGFVVINLDPRYLSRAQALGEALVEQWKSFLPESDHKFYLSWQEWDHSPEILSENDKNSVLSFMTLFPHGVHTYNSLTEKLAGLSNNFARLLVVRGKFYAQTSVRFFDRAEATNLELQLKTLGQLFGFSVTSQSEYPSWKPQRENPLLDQVKGCYQALFQQEPQVKAIHAGLECGILRDKIGAIDVVSFGPTIMGAHSPDERVHIPSVEKFWELYKAVLKTI
jgi:dipeptidase D